MNMYKLRRELKNCLWVSLLLLVALTVMLLTNNGGPINTYEIDADRSALVSTDISLK